MELNYTPDYRIEYQGKNLTEALRPHITAIRFVDEIGSHADKLTLQFDDRLGALEVPQTGHKLDFHLGYKETGLDYMGFFAVGDIEFTGPPMSMNVSATSLDFSSKLKEKRNTSYEALTLVDLVRKIAERHNLFYQVYLPNAEVVYEHVAQTDESDLHIMRRLANAIGADVSIKNGLILFFEKGKEPRQNKKVTLTPPDISRYSITASNRKDYSKVIAKWHDTDKATEQKVEVGDNSGPVFIIKQTFQDEKHAHAAAEGKLKALKRGKISGRLTLPGRTDIPAGAVVVLKGFRKGLDGEYTAKQVSHAIDRQGWRLDIQLEG